MTDTQVAYPTADMQDALPEGFDFYHLGRVEKQGEPASWSLKSPALAFRLSGDIKGALIFLYTAQEKPDSSQKEIYSELGNILASRFASQLRSTRNLEVMISPPQNITENRLGEMLARFQPIISKSYCHIHVAQLLRIHMLVFAIPEEEIGHA